MLVVGGVGVIVLRVKVQQVADGVDSVFEGFYGLFFLHYPHPNLQNNLLSLSFCLQGQVLIYIIQQEVGYKGLLLLGFSSSLGRGQIQYFTLPGRTLWQKVYLEPRYIQMQSSLGEVSMCVFSLVFYSKESLRVIRRVLGQFTLGGTALILYGSLGGGIYFLFSLLMGVMVI